MLEAVKPMTWAGFCFRHIERYCRVGLRPTLLDLPWQSVTNLNHIVSSLYSAAANRVSWTKPLQSISESLDLWSTQIIGVDKKRRTLIFSASGWGSRDRPEAELDYVRFYHHSNPRLAPAMQLEVGQWLHCHEHFDDNFVRHNSFYQEFLIPNGGRYLSGTKLIDDDQYVFLLGMMRGVGSVPLAPTDMPFLETVRHHALEAMRNRLHIRATFAEKEMSQSFVEQFRYPMLVLDESRGIWNTNEDARKLLDRRDLLQEVDGHLMCGTAKANDELSAAIRSLYIGAQCEPLDVQRRVITIPHRNGTARLFVSALRPEQSMNMFGSIPRVLVIVHERSGTCGELDPLLVAECFSLTPAEARIAVKLASGMSVKEIAAVLGTREATVRTQVKRTLQKTETTRQADLIRLLVSMPLCASVT